MTRVPGGADVSQERRYEGISPQHQVQLTSSLDLPGSVSFDWFLRYVSELRVGSVPAYATSNVRVAWQPSPGIEIALIGRNLHQPRQLEWPSGASGNVEIERSARINVVWRR